VVVVALAAACSGERPAPVGAPVNPHPVGEAVEVGGWYPVETLLDGSTAIVNKTGDRQSSGWFVTVVSPGACPPDPVVEGKKEAICVGLEIRNNTEQAGGLKIHEDLPVLSNSPDGQADVMDLWIAGMESTALASSTSSSTNCTLSAPDGGQEADCTAIVVMGGGTVPTGWATVGAGKTARFDLEYIVGPLGESGFGLHWTDGTWFALP
jgi:hypothetical protein